MDLGSIARDGRFQSRDIGNLGRRWTRARGHPTCLIGREERFQRSRYAAFRVRYACEVQAHLDAAQRARQHDIVEASQMSDPKHLAGQLAETG